MKFFFLIIIIIFSVSQLKALEPEPMAINATFNGYVLDSATNETLVGATVAFKGTKLGTYTNKSGYFSITNIIPGDYTIIVSYLGYEKKILKIKFGERESVRREIKLKHDGIKTQEISVEAEREVEKREITISKVNVPIEQLKEIRIGGESDVFRSLQFLPGVLTSSQISSGLYIRGGSPDQNLILVDGSVVYNPTHLFGFISTFNSDAIKDVELIKGGFPAEYGGRLSSVLNLTQKDGNQNNIDGTVSLGALSSKASLEGPLFNGSWFISGRRTYLEIIKAFIPDDPTSPLPDFHFYDLNVKISQNFGSNDKLFISGFMSADALAMDGYGMNMSLDIGNQLLSTKWTHIFGDNLFTVLNFSYSKYKNRFFGDQSGYEFLIDNNITDYTVKGSVEWFTSDVLTTKFGFESTKYTFGYLQNFTGDADSTSPGSNGGTLNLLVDDWNHSLFGQLNYRVFDLLSLQGGLRVNYWMQRNLVTLEPRIALRYQFQENIALKAAWGIYHQNLRLATMPDFSFFDTWLPTDSTVPASKSNHYIFSIETNPVEGYDLNFDVYYKTMNNINEINMNSLEGSTVSDVFYIGNAESYGVEVFLQKKFGNFTGWFGYSLGYIYAKFPQINNGNEFRPKYDRRHDLKLVLQYKLNDEWEFGGSFTFQSGQSYTGATSRFQSRLIDQNYGRGKIFPSQRFGLRLPPSHQLNISASYSFTTFGLPSKLILDVYNVYNRRDIWFRYYNTQKEETNVEDVRLLPILPSISYELKF
ncbi:MAG: TonB-dependent receptor [Bacteroidetes bacterium]|nr:MAG: TonB-dependent receptor [Bacteroidota bacterium]